MYCKQFVYIGNKYMLLPKSKCCRYRSFFAQVIFLFCHCYITAGYDVNEAVKGQYSSNKRRTSPSASPKSGRKPATMTPQQKRDKTNIATLRKEFKNMLKQKQNGGVPPPEIPDSKVTLMLWDMFLNFKSARNKNAIISVT